MTLRRENFTEAAQEAIGASQQLVRRYRHAQWDLEHLFLALLEQEEGVPAQVLRKLGADHRSRPGPGRRGPGAFPAPGVRAVADLPDAAGGPRVRERQGGSRPHE